MILTLLIVLGLLVVTFGYVAVDHAALAAAWGVLLGVWVHAAFDEIDEHRRGSDRA